MHYVVSAMLYLFLSAAFLAQALVKGLRFSHALEQVPDTTHPAGA
jgi:hypothetical protein